MKTQIRKSVRRPARGLAPVVALLAGMVSMTMLASGAPARPDGVAPEAIWVGGMDGGVFLLVVRDPSDGNGLYRGCVFADGGPYLLYNGLLRKHGPGPVAGPLDRPETYDGWDGTRLYLADGGWLRAVSPFNPFTLGHDESAEACDLDYAATEPPRPPGIPAGGAWLGGPYDGAFVFVMADVARLGVFQVQAYYDYSGELWHSGPFVLDPPGTGPVHPVELDDWDGIELFLADGRRLVPVATGD